MYSIAFSIVHTPLSAQEKKLRFNHLTTDEGLSQNIVFGIVKDKYGFMWFGTWGGLNKYDGYKFTIYNADKENLKAIPDNRIIGVNIDSAGNVWAMTIDSVLVRYNYETDDFTKFNKSDVSKWFANFMNKSINQSHKKITTNEYEWKGGSNVLIQTNLQNRNIVNYSGNVFDKWAIHINNSPWLYLDNNQILWVGSYFNGICYADILQKSFSFIRIEKDDEKNQLILNNKVRAICKDNTGNLWIGTSEDGISQYNIPGNKSIHFKFDLKNNSSDRRNLFLNQIRGIYCDRHGNVWIGSNAGVRKYNPKTKKTTHYWLQSEFGEINISVRSIIEDYRGDVWICTRSSIQKYDRINDRFIKYNPLKSLGIEHPKYRILIEDKKRNFWVTTEVTGLVRLKRDSTLKNDEKFTTTVYKYNAGDSASIGDNSVFHVYEDETGIIWAGTNEGISSFDPEKKRFRRFNKKSGLPDDFILGILSDYKGNIWVSHKKGLTRINATTFATRNYSVNDGLLSNEFMENSCYRDDSTGLLYFGSLNGLVYFNPDSLKDNPYPPKIVFTNLQIGDQNVKINQIVNGSVILTKPLYLTKEIKLNYANRHFAVEFAALHFSNPQKNEYRYKLEGFDQNWITTTSSIRLAQYSNLEPKTYILKVKASNNDGVWNEEGISLKVIIIAPWWKTWWFKILVVLLISTMLYLIYKIRIAIYQKRQLELDLLVKERTIDLEKSNTNLLESQTRIEEYAEEVTIQSEKLKSTNALLMEQQSQIEEQSEELRVHTENLKGANELLLNKQVLIEKQSDVLNKTNDELTKLNSTKDILFSIIAHDLKNPFHSIIGFSDLLLSKLESLPIEKSKIYISLINDVATSAYDLLENLLQWSRTQTGRINFEPEMIDPASIANNVMRLLESNAQAKQIELKQQISSSIKIYADENMLHTILRNLISNAIKFTNKHGVISTQLTMDNNTVKISVTDTGIGISQETQELLFRTDAMYTTKGTSNEGGTGIGLLICKEFVELHHGKIWVESEVGKGSTFYFTLPQGK